jgi:hypothetical protein
MLFGSRFVIMAVLLLFVSAGTGHAQLTEKFEVGGQFSVLQLSVPFHPPTGPFRPPVVIGSQRDTELGFGGRFGYNVNENIAVEGELNFFPSAKTFTGEVGFSTVAEIFGDGHNLEGLFGMKAGKRFERVGIFAKARPGFLSESNGGLQPQQEGICILIFPPPAGCFDAKRKTFLAFDVGAVVEVYPSKRTVIRIDAGDTMVRVGERTVPVAFSTHLGALPVPAETTHNFQASVGFAFRF